MLRAITGLLVLLLLGFPLSVAVAADNQQGDPKDDAKALADQQRSVLEALAKTAPDAKSIPGFVGTSVPQSGYNPTQLADPLTQPADNASAQASNSMQSLATRPTLDPTKYQNALGVMANPSAQFDLDGFLSGTYADCDPHTLTTSSSAGERRCDAWRVRKNSSCYVNREVDVKADVTYSCDKDSARIHKRCERTLSKKCGIAGICDTAGLKLESLQSDYGATVSNGLITIGRAGSRTWCGSFCSTRDRSVRFEVNDVGAVETFRIVNGGFDDWIHIKLNGQIVWVGHGALANGDISVKTVTSSNYQCRWEGGRDGQDVCGIVTNSSTGVYQGSERIGGCERARHWPIPQIDLKPYLREGQNHLQVRIISSGCGDGYFRIQAQSSCCNRWRESWVETCN